ncbi:MAG TPA: aspartate kinase [Myxococcota bacterium]|nr:aspartate kinase [Myxococcota bacterium]HQK49772.1 aspartate kinase [Myxococcota bacterium]
MAIQVLKFGGSSVADPERIGRVAEVVVQRRREGHDVVVVVSAMGRTTDQLLDLARQINPNPSTRELDMLLSVGERTTTALMAMALQRLGQEAVSLTGSQCGILTNASHSHARIIEIRPFRVWDELEAGRVVVVAGYQGTSYKREITTLGRGGSDTTAVALAAALGAERCEIWSDIEGVYTADPRVVLDAGRLQELSYEEMLDLSRFGAKVLNAEAVEFARRAGIVIYTRSSVDPSLPGSVIRANPPAEPRAVTGVACRRPVTAVEWPPGDGAGLEAVQEVLRERALVPDFVTGTATGIAWMVFSESANPGLGTVLGEVLAGTRAGVRPGLATVTAVGDVAAHEDLRTRMLPCLEELGGQVLAMFLSPVAITLLVEGGVADLVTRRVHRWLLGEGVPPVRDGSGGTNVPGMR